MNNNDVIDALFGTIFLVSLISMMFSTVAFMITHDYVYFAIFIMFVIWVFVTLKIMEE